LSRIAPLSLLLLLAGCGFQLQGTLTVPPQMERTYISAPDRHSGFYRDLRAAFEAAGVNVVDNGADATATFRIAYDETDQRVLSVSARNVPTEYEVYYTIEYSLESDQQNLLETQVLTLTRDYTYDSTLVLGKGQEEELLREAIIDDLVRIVLKQISAL
jgi:LPS-assembly lipoprotein